MDGEDDCFKQLEIRRLGTPSSVLLSGQIHLSTVWKWYWLSDAEEWIEIMQLSQETNEPNPAISTEKGIKLKEYRNEVPQTLLNTEGRKQYDKEFLHSLQFAEQSIRKPEELPDMPGITFDEVVPLVGLYEDEEPWNEHMLSELQTCVNCELIELEYQENPQGQMQFAAGAFKYVLDFEAMVLKNLEDGHEREVRRRPVFISKEALEQKKKQRIWSKSTRISCVIPSFWEIEDDALTEDGLMEHFSIVSVNKVSKEFQTVCSSFFKTMPEDTEVLSIQRIQNGDLWLSYCRAREKMQKKLKLTEEQFKEKKKEMQLFHGTDASHIESICHQGFDFRLGRKSAGTRFGKGCYFALDAKYAGNFTDQNGLLMARVLVGDYVLGNTLYQRPPQKANHELYDTCVNNETNPDIFVVFDLYNSYPEYIIKY